MTIKKFEVGKTYVDSEQLIEIIVTKRTAKNIFFKYFRSQYFVIKYCSIGLHL